MAGHLMIVVTDDWYLRSHRIGLAVAAREAGYEVTVATRVGEYVEVSWSRAAGRSIEWLLRIQNDEQGGRGMHRDPGFPEALLVPRQDGLGMDPMGGLDDDGVFEIAVWAGNRALEDPPGDRRHTEYREKGLDLLARIRQPHDLARKVEDRSEGSSARETLDFAPVGTREEFRREVREGTAVKEEVEKNIGVEQDLQRCLSSTWVR